MLDGQLLAFMGVALVISVTPGPDMALVLRNSIRGGRPAAYRTILGTGVGLIGWATASAVGIAAVLEITRELAVAIPDQKAHRPRTLRQAPSELTACWVTQAPLGFAVQPARCTRRLPSWMKKST